MGCDIHLYTEYKTVIDKKDVWVNCDNWRLNPYYREDEDECEYQLNSLYDSRDYSMFAVLAGVRDYSEGNQKISEPKDLPSGVSSIIQKESDRWDSDGHSHSYFTLRELREHQKNNKTIKHSGLISPAQADALDNSGSIPNSWCQGSSDSSMVWRAWEEEQDVLAAITSPLDAVMRDVMWIFNDDENVEAEGKIRIVFWFDN